MAGRSRWRRPRPPGSAGCNSAGAARRWSRPPDRRHGSRPASSPSTRRCRRARCRSVPAPGRGAARGAAAGRRASRSSRSWPRRRLHVKILYGVCAWGLGHAIHRRYRRLLVPDAAEDGGLSGRLAHELHCWAPSQLVYLGLLSDLTPGQRPASDAGTSLDTLVVLGGPEPSRSRLEARLLPDLARLPGRTVVLRGLPAGDGPPWPIGGVEALPHASRDERDRLFGAARVIVGRSGYSTLMDVAQVGARALLVPMRGQTEQEYLAARLARKGLVHAVAERDVDLARDVPLARTRRGLDGFVHPGTDAAARAVAEILA